MKKLIYSLALKALYLALDYVYNYVDSDKDGKLSKEELEKVYEIFKKLMRKVRRS